jgi:hypothetical protein
MESRFDIINNSIDSIIKDVNSEVVNGNIYVKYICNNGCELSASQPLGMSGDIDYEIEILQQRLIQMFGEYIYIIANELSVEDFIKIKQTVSVKGKTKSKPKNKDNTLTLFN